MSRGKPSSLGRRLLEVGIFLAALAIAFAGYFFYDPAPTAVRPVFPPIPNPNALDTYLAASHAKTALHLLPSFAKDAHAWTPEQTRANLAKGIPLNAEVFRLFELAQTQKFAWRARALGSYFEVSGPNDHMALKDLAKLLSAKSDHELREGRPRDALTTALDGLEFSERIGQGGDTLCRLISRALYSIELTALWKAAAKLPQGVDPMQLKRLDALASAKFSYSRLLETQMSIDLWTMLNGTKDWDWKVQMMRSDDSPAGGGSLERRWKQATDSRRAAYRQLKAHFAYWIDRTQKPFGPRNRATEPAITSPLAEIFASPEMAFSLWVHDLVRQAATRLLAAEMAIRNFRRDRGQLPKSLAELVPKYLQEVPLDPFQAGKPLIYQPKGNAYRLYSLGPDQVDDKGARAFDMVNGKKAYRVFEGTKGDVVPGPMSGNLP